MPSTRVVSVASGPKRSSAVELVKSLLTEAGMRAVSARTDASVRPVVVSSTKPPETPPPRASRLATSASSGAAAAEPAQTASTSARSRAKRCTGITTALERGSLGRLRPNAVVQSVHMGKVVSLETSARARRAATSSHGRRAGARQRKASKTALVLGGGGFTGAVYEIGALRALDLLSVNRSVTDFDIYVGTSAGSLVAAMTANGVSPEEMMRVLDRQAPTPFPEIALGTLLSLNLREVASKAIAFPWRMTKLGWNLARHVGQVSALDVVLGIAEGLPSGLYSGEGIEDYVRRVLDDEGRTDDFRRLERQLYITATDLDTCE